MSLFPLTSRGRSVAVLLAAAGLLVRPGISALAADGPKEHIVEIVSDYDNMRMAFRPKMLHIEPGDTVTWVNLVAEDHNVVSYPDGYPKGAGPLSSPYLKHAGEKWSHKFAVGGTYEYHCIPHLPMGMHGTVIVAHPSKAEEFHVPSASEMLAYSKRLREFFDEAEFKYKTRNERHKTGNKREMKH